MNPTSNCCNAAVTVVGGAEGTKHYCCLNCKMPCDAYMYTKCSVCGRTDIQDWDGEGRCITCAREAVSDPVSQMFEDMGVKVVDVTPKDQPVMDSSDTLPTGLRQEIYLLLHDCGQTCSIDAMSDLCRRSVDSVESLIQQKTVEARMDEWRRFIEFETGGNGRLATLQSNKEEDTDGTNK